VKVKTEKIGELVFAEIFAEDENGNIVENANNRVTVSVKNGELLGLDNGDSTDYDQYQGTNSRRLFNGKLLAIATASSEISAELDSTDIPIRKIELIRESEGNTEKITANIFPKNATHRELEWRIADSAGIDSPLARLSLNEETDTCVSLHPKGDGEIYIRCSAKNGKDHISLISVLPIQITGYGKPFLDPYSFISGGLYTTGNNTVTNGNERGVATARDKESIFGFTDLDFGTFGADEITLWLFPLSGDPFQFEIHLGDKLLYTADYNKGTQWNTYKEVTYKLPEKLRGIQALSFVFRQKVHVKGFRFKSKTYEKIPFAAHDKIYGDSYKIAETAVENIGNNVTIGFASLNFTEPAKTLELHYRSRQNTNTIRLKFTNEDGGEVENMLTLSESPDYSAAKLTLENPLCGKGQVDFIFLPGSEIDLEHLRFEKG
jgi:beta-galactosidase